MTTRDHVRLPRLARTAPIRGAGAVLRPAEIPGAPAARDVGTGAPAAASPTGPSAPAAASPTRSGPVEQCIHTAYSILARELDLGREAARMYTGAFNRGGTMDENRPGIASDGVLRLWGEMFGLWIDFLGPLAPPGLRDAFEQWGVPVRGEAGARGHGPRAQGANAAPRSSPQSLESSRVTFDVLAPKRVEITLDLPADVDVAALDVPDMSAVGQSGGAAITGSKLERVEGRVIVRLTIRPDQPAGTYLGMIIDRVAQEQRGKLRVVVHP